MIEREQHQQELNEHLEKMRKQKDEFVRERQRVEKMTPRELREKIGKMPQELLNERISKMTPEELHYWFDLLVSEVGVEPVYGGCVYPCPKCVYEGDRPETPFSMKIQNLKKTLRWMVQRGMQPRRFYYALRGESGLHRRLSGITAAIKEAYPKAYTEFYWGLRGIKNRKQLEKRTEGGLGMLRLSLDDPHLSAVIKELKAAGVRRNVRELAVEEITRRLEWVKSAAEKNGFEVGLHLAGSKAEQDRWLEMTQAVGLKIKPEHIVRSARIPQGNEVGRFASASLGTEARMILHDGSLVEKFPDPKKTAAK